MATAGPSETGAVTVVPRIIPCKMTHAETLQSGHLTGGQVAEL